MERRAVVLRLSLVAAVLLAVLSLPSALAEDVARERIFLVFAGEETSALEQEALRFQGPVLDADRFEFAGTKEMEAIYTTCTEEIGTNAETRRECQLRAANRIMVTQVLQLRGSKLDAQSWDVALEVWSPETNGLVWGTTLEVEASSLRKAARAALPRLAASYLCWRDVEAACDGAAPAATVEVPPATTSTTVAVEPLPATPDARETGGQSSSARAPEGTVEVAAGTFWMGCNDAVDEHCRDGESPYREVYLDAFAIDVHEVTVADYAACVDAGHCSAPGKSNADGDRFNWGAESRRDHPVNAVTQAQAATYCAWAGKRLPTEAEWEKAARGTDGRTWPWGEKAPSCKRAVMDAGDGNGCGTDATQPVGSKPRGKSPYGAHDMAGNAMEWVADRFDRRTYSTAPASNPTGPATGEPVARGGGYSSDAIGLRVAGRFSWKGDVLLYPVGFRCAWSAP